MHTDVSFQAGGSVEVRGSLLPNTTDAVLGFGSGLLRVDRSPNERHPWRPSPGFPGRSGAKARL